MKKILLLITITLFSLYPLMASPIHIGLEGTFGTAIGTGKGNWDWTDPSLGIQRSTPLNSGAAVMFLIDLTAVLQVETAAGYYWNKTAVANGNEKWVYTQESLEFPLGIRLFLNRHSRGLYVKGGTALIILTGKSSFKNENSGEDLFISNSPENRTHTGMQIGIGYQKETKRGLWELEAKYITFYSSPDYRRIDKSRGDTRFHRMGINFGLFF